MTMHTSDPSETAKSESTCCVVGGGPAGAVLSLLLAREGIPVTLLEAHKDFDREFRGDTLHPSTMELMDQLGLANSLLELPHMAHRNKIATRGSSPAVPNSRAAVQAMLQFFPDGPY